MAKRAVDALDVRIANYLLEFEKADVGKMAKKLGTTPQTIYERIKKMKERGVIEGVFTKFSADALGYDIVGVVMVKLVENNSADKFAAKHEKKSNITLSCLLVGTYDVLFMGKFGKATELTAFVDELRKDENVDYADLFYVPGVRVERPMPFPLAADG